MSSVRSTSDGRSPVTRKRVPDREEPGKPRKDAQRGCCHPLEAGFWPLWMTPLPRTTITEYWLRDRPVASAYVPSIEGAGTRVCGYAIKNSGLTVEVILQHLHVCVKELRVKIRSPQGVGVYHRIVTSGREVKARGGARGG